MIRTKTQEIKKKIIKALEDDKPYKHNSKCVLLIIPFCSKKEAESKEFKHYARNILEVDDDFYEEILKDYKDFKGLK